MERDVNYNKLYKKLSSKGTIMTNIYEVMQSNNLLQGVFSNNKGLIQNLLQGIKGDGARKNSTLH